jgi:hypothetical protein
VANERKYTIAICKGAALLEETRTLLDHWSPDESLDSFAARVQDKGILGNATAYRVRDIVRRVFAPRFLKPSTQPAVILKSILEHHLPFSAFREMVFLSAARNDTLIYDFTTTEFWPSVRRGRAFLDVETVLSFFSAAVANGLIEKPWSEQVSKKVARGLLGLLRDIGFMRDSVRSRKDILPYRMSDEGLLILAKELHDAGLNNASLCAHPDWGLFGMSQSVLLERLQLFDESRGLIFQRAGSVVAINWTVASVEALIQLLAEGSGRTVSQ